MSKAKRILVDWLAEGERGWVDPDGWRWKWDGKRMRIRGTKGSGHDFWDRSVAKPENTAVLPEVFPRPAAKPPKVVKVRAWGLIDQWNRLAGVHYTKKYALKMKCRGDTIIPLEGTYTPKRMKP